MNDDHDLDRLVATAASVRDEWLGEADLRDAENELLEEIMATGRAPDITLSPRPTTTTTEALPPEAPLPLRRTSHLPGRTRRSRVAVAVGLVAAAVIGVVVVRSTASNDDERGGVAAGDTIAPVIVDPVPEGFSVTVAQPEEGPDPQPAQVDERTDLFVYGELSATALTNDVVIGVTVLADAPYVPKYGEAVTVRGRSGSRCSPGANVCFFGTDMTGIEWRQGPGLVITVMSRAFDGDQLLAIADGLIVEGDTAVLGDVPDGVTTPPQVATLKHPMVPAYTVDYASPDGRTISLTTELGSPALRIYSLWRWGARDDTVQGHRAALADLGGGAYYMTWEPVPGQLIGIETNGIDEADVRALAETVRPATSAEWAEAQRLAAADPSDGEPHYLPPPPGAAERVLADGTTEVRGWRTDDGELCYEYVNSGQDQWPTQFCEPDNQGTTALGLVAIGSSDGRDRVAPAVVGVAPEDTASIDGGEVTFGEEVDGGRLFVWELATGSMPTSLTFRNADGEEISTTEVVTYD